MVTPSENEQGYKVSILPYHHGGMHAVEATGMCLH